MNQNCKMSCYLAKLQNVSIDTVMIGKHYNQVCLFIYKYIALYPFIKCCAYI